MHSVHAGVSLQEEQTLNRIMVVVLHSCMLRHAFCYELQYLFFQRLNETVRG